MDGIYNYIANTLLAPENAMGQYDRIAEAILTLESFPERYPIFDVSLLYPLQLQRMIISVKESGYVL